MHSAMDWNLLYPLNEFYERSGQPLPLVTRLAGEDIPEQYRSLLVHERDMTRTLENAHGQSIHLRVLRRSVDNGVLSREVVLVLEDDVTSVELGSIKIYLEQFPDRARRLLLECHQPLGTILHTQSIAYESHPAAYFQVSADAMIREALELHYTFVIQIRLTLHFIIVHTISL